MIDRVRCGNCGEQFDANDDEDLNSRAPCPSCGSTAPTISISVSDTISLDAILVKAHTPDLLLQTIIISGKKSTEGRKLRQ